MRINIAGFIILLVINILVDIYIARAIRKRIRPRWPLMVHYAICGVSLALFTILSVCMPIAELSDGMFCVFAWILLAFIALIVPRYLFTLIDLCARIPELFRHRRCRPVSIAGGAVAVLSFVMIIWGACVTRLSVQVKEIDVPVDNLPEAFDGYRIAQISDMHVGTYGDDDSFVKKVVKEVNALDADLVVFTGDIVNRHADEIRPFTCALSELKGRDGQFAILGNHDYADYYYPDDQRARENDRARLINFYSLTSFDLILDDYRTIYRGNDSIIVIGVENIGQPPFPAYGNLDIAYPSLDDDNTKILLSHDPSHWHNDIAGHADKNIALTLSGHTHAMQTRLLGWSPAALMHPEWGGLYTDDSGRHSLYVNIGTGTVGTPMRIGATPEITLITLHRK